MLTPALRRLALLALAAGAALGAPVPAAAVVQVDACGDLTRTGETYVLTVDIAGSDVCFRLLADRITLDLGGHTITGPGTGSLGSVAVWDGDAGRTGLTVRNGSVQNYYYGIYLDTSTRSTVRAFIASDNVFGMVIGANSLVKDCTVQRNQGTGIVTRDAVQVQSCHIGGTDLLAFTPLPGDGNGGYGLVGGQRMLVTGNTSSDNGRSGILVGIASTVTGNTASGNGEHGIAVGLRSLVTNNTANNNFEDGIEVVCPSTVTNNKASGNSINFDFVGSGCFLKNNTSPGEGGNDT